MSITLSPLIQMKMDNGWRAFNPQIEADVYAAHAAKHPGWVRSIICDRRGRWCAQQELEDSGSRRMQVLGATTGVAMLWDGERAAKLQPIVQEPRGWPEDLPVRTPDEFRGLFGQVTEYADLGEWGMSWCSLRELVKYDYEQLVIDDEVVFGSNPEYQAHWRHFQNVLEGHRRDDRHWVRQEHQELVVCRDTGSGDTSVKRIPLVTVRDWLGVGWFHALGAMKKLALDYRRSLDEVRLVWGVG